jgi:hypothetical protein
MNKVLKRLKAEIEIREYHSHDTFLLKLAAQEIERLLEGNFTEEEFQNLCHNFSEDDAKRFSKGCIEYNQRMFGEKSCLKPH